MASGLNHQGRKGRTVDSGTGQNIILRRQSSSKYTKYDQQDPQYIPITRTLCYLLTYVVVVRWSRSGKIVHREEALCLVLARSRAITKLTWMSDTSEAAARNSNLYRNIEIFESTKSMFESSDVSTSLCSLMVPEYIRIKFGEWDETPFPSENWYGNLRNYSTKITSANDIFDVKIAAYLETLVLRSLGRQLFWRQK